MTSEIYVSYYTEHFQEQYLSLSDRDVERVRSCIIMLESMPRMGRRYDPQYEADEPSFSCRYFTVPRTTKCLFFTIDEQAKALHFFLLGDARQDPTNRFAGIHSDR